MGKSLGIINVHVWYEDKPLKEKENFYEELTRAYQKIPKYDAKETSMQKLDKKKYMGLL